MSAVDVMTPPADSSDDMRVSTPEASEGSPRSHHTAIIFDWDDTLLSSSWLAQNGLRLEEPAVVPEEARVQLDALAESVILLVERAMTFGPVCIITNAETGWVELSAKKFLPAVVPLLSRVRVLSARSTFECLCPCPTEWKVHAFKRELESLYEAVDESLIRNVISFGDSIHERNAIHRVTERMAGVRTKSVKFVERPTIEQLKRQVDLVHGCIEEIVHHTDNLDLMLTIQLLFT